MRQNCRREHRGHPRRCGGRRAGHESRLHPGCNGEHALGTGRGNNRRGDGYLDLRKSG